MNLLFIALLIVAQGYTTPDWPELPTATPYGTLEPGATRENPIDEQQIQENIDRSQAGIIELATSAAVYQNQIYVDGSPVLPDTSGAVTSWSYFKWMTSSAGYSLFGGFAPVFGHVAVIMSVSVIALLIFILVRVAVFFIEFLQAILNWTLKLWGALPFT